MVINSACSMFLSAISSPPNGKFANVSWYGICSCRSGYVARSKERRRIPHLSFLCQLFHESPSLSTSPRKVLGILSIITESVLPEFPNTTSDDVLYRVFDTRTVANLVNQLMGARVQAIDKRPWAEHERYQGHSLAHLGVRHWRLPWM